MALPMQYETRYYWSGESKNGDLEIDERPALPMGAPIDTRVFNPEHLLLAASEVCLANTFFAIAESSRLKFTAYRSHAEGELEFVEREGYRFHDILITVKIRLNASDEDKARRILDKAHDACLIARSLNFPVRMKAEFLTD